MIFILNNHGVKQSLSTQSLPSLQTQSGPSQKHGVDCGVDPPAVKHQKKRIGPTIQNNFDPFVKHRADSPVKHGVDPPAKYGTEPPLNTALTLQSDPPIDPP
jgi:hypothetical protein